ncbi:hypothetical protein EUTSA_v10017677mg, partial [Eutrema salsugineum]
PQITSVSRNYSSMRTKRKLGFLDGTLKKPASGDDAEKWTMVNLMIIGWIYASVEPKLHSSISLVENALDMWSSIKGRYGIGDGIKEHQLHADLTACKQDIDNIEDYFARLKLIWMRLQMLTMILHAVAATPGVHR